MLFNIYEHKILECSFFPKEPLPIIEEIKDNRMVIKGEFYSETATSHEEVVLQFNSLKPMMFSVCNYDKELIFIELKDSLMIDTVYSESLKIYGVYYVAIIEASKRAKEIIYKHSAKKTYLYKKDNSNELEYKLNFIECKKNINLNELIENKTQAFYITSYYPDKYLPKYNLDNWKYTLPLEYNDLYDSFDNSYNDF